MLRALARGTQALLEFALPQRCPACAAPAPATQVLCEACWAHVPRLDRPVCARCLLEGHAPDGCLRHTGDRVHAAWLYDERLTQVMHAFKFEGRPALATILAEGMAVGLRTRPRPDFIIAVPLHPVRRRERGHDQAAGLARALARVIEVPVIEGALERTRATEAQSGLGPRARRRNLRGAFQVRGASGLGRRRVWVVDDVLTTGATLHEAMATLRAAGARTQGVVAAWAG